MAFLIELAVILALAGGLIFGLHKAWEGFKAAIAAPYVQVQIKADQPKIDAAEANAREADAERDHARQDTQACHDAAAAQSASIQRLAERSNAALAASKAAAEAARQRAANSASEVARLQAIATAAAAKGESCEAQLAKVDKLLRDSARARMATKPVQPLPAGK